MRKVLIALLALGVCLLGKPLVLPVESPVINVAVPKANADDEQALLEVIPLGQIPSGTLDSLWVDQDMVSPPEKYEIYADDDIIRPMP
jgi:hypothetical protein